MPEEADRGDASFARLKYLIASDLYRYDGGSGPGVLWEHLLHGTGSKYMIWARISKYLSRKGIVFAPLYAVARLMTKRLGVKYGISIPWRIDIGPGFYIGHHGCIFISPDAVIGKNCNISQAVTIGVGNRGKIGVPVIGDNVYIGPGATLFGRIRIGNNVAIGANAVVSRSIKPNSVVVSAPPEILLTNDPSLPIFGSKGYVNRTDYDERLRK